MRLGVDIGGTKIEVAAIEGAGAQRLRRRIPTPHGAYEPALEALAQLILQAESEAQERCTVGVGMPGVISPDTGLLANAYNTPYNGRALKPDLERMLKREVRFANDANCFALSEALDGAARGARVVFGAILGTGVGGGIVVERRMLEGRHGIAGEWGHTPLPWMSAEEHPGPLCNCGRRGCIEQFVSGPAKNRELARLGEAQAMARYADRLARAFSLIINVLDPDMIVVGGGMSKHDQIYAEVPALLSKYVYCERPSTPIVRAAHGDSSGVRGAAMLWPAT
ncbi:MAG: ROK family protein [Betaproteobacteria bacterium]|nr:ROK family protein [Betaproteobacteria bacterium]